MRVLDPNTKNPFFKFVHKVVTRIGGEATILTTGALTMGTPTAVFFAAGTPGTVFLGALSAIPAYVGLARYQANTKSNRRLTKAYEYRELAGADYYPEVDAVIAEIFACPRDHKQFSGTAGNHYIDTYGYTRKQIESEAKRREARDEIDQLLTLGNNCKYCGERIKTIKDLADEVQSSRVDGGEVQTKLDNLREVLEHRRLANLPEKDFEARMAEIRATTTRKELT